MDATRKHFIKNNLQTILTSLEILHDINDVAKEFSSSELDEISTIMKNMMLCVQRINEAIEKKLDD